MKILLSCILSFTCSLLILAACSSSAGNGTASSSLSSSSSSQPSTNVSDMVLGYWYMSSCWTGTGATNTNYSTNGYFWTVYCFNTNHSFDLWGLTGPTTYGHSNLSYYILNSNEISNLILPFGVPSIGNSWGRMDSSNNNGAFGETWETIGESHSAYYNNHQIFVTNQFLTISNFSYTNGVTNGITNYGTTNTSSSNANRAVYIVLEPTTNLNLPK